MLTWSEFETFAASCRSCRLCEKRNSVVIGRGCRETGRILFVGEGPGEHEDREGLPFVGQAGRLFDFALEALEFPEEAYYIANVVKCRPPQNRDPAPDEIEACLKLLRQQFLLLRPTIVVALGSVAAKALISPDAQISKVRGQWFNKGGTMFTATYHPAALLRNDALKFDFYRDLKEVKKRFFGPDVPQ
ncbi:MAG: uracil-DNA glycosylase [Clostridia bacterium]|nr:uracil-DNA glycosylase [Clostridia bacterium]